MTVEPRWVVGWKKVGTLLTGSRGGCFRRRLVKNLSRPFEVSLYTNIWSRGNEHDANDGGVSNVVLWGVIDVRLPSRAGSVFTLGKHRSPYLIFSCVSLSRKSQDYKAQIYLLLRTFQLPSF